MSTNPLFTYAKAIVTIEQTLERREKENKEQTKKIEARIEVLEDEIRRRKAELKYLNDVTLSDMGNNEEAKEALRASFMNEAEHQHPREPSEFYQQLYSDMCFKASKVI